MAPVQTMLSNHSPALAEPALALSACAPHVQAELALVLLVAANGQRALGLLATAASLIVLLEVVEVQLEVASGLDVGPDLIAKIDALAAVPADSQSVTWSSRLVGGLQLANCVPALVQHSQVPHSPVLWASAVALPVFALL